MQRRAPQDLVIRPAQADDHAAAFAVNQRQESSWWGVPEGDESDTRMDFRRAEMATGSLEFGTRIAVSSDRVVGFAALVGHGEATLSIDPTADGSVDALARLIDWLRSQGATVLDSPAQDSARLRAFADHGYLPSHSSFDMTRPVPIDDLGSARWPEGVEPAGFTPSIDAEVHSLVYSVWGDVPGLTDRPLDEWRSVFFSDSEDDPALVVLARRRTPEQRLAGAALCRVVPDGAGWVAQLAVGRPDQGVGLGRALLIEAFRRLVERGATSLGLNVLAANEQALGLYRSVGLEVDREWVHCQRVHPAES
jgi:GNAT superfamily N-acetyltransferase